MQNLMSSNCVGYESYGDGRNEMSAIKSVIDLGFKIICNEIKKIERQAKKYAFKAKIPPRECLFCDICRPFVGNLKNGMLVIIFTGHSLNGFIQHKTGNN